MTVDESKSVVTVVGGGNSAHVLIPFLSASGHKVNLLTRRPEAWSKEVTCELQRPSKKKEMVCYGNVNHPSAEVLQTVKGGPSRISSDPKDVIPEADVIVLCMPVHQYRDALNRLAPYINRRKKEVFVGTVYGQAGFNWMVHEVERNYRLENVCPFAAGLIPWICRTMEYGKLAANYGTKAVNVAAVTPYNKFDRLKEIFFDDITVRWHDGKGEFQQACSFLSLTLSVDNQIVHPGRCYGLWKRYGGKWATEDDIPFFYKDFDDVSAECMRLLDADYTKVRDAVRQKFPERDFKFMLDYLNLERTSHNSENVNIKDSLKNSEQLALIKTPTVEKDDGFYLNTDCRFFTDDIPYGLLIARWVGQELGVETPFVDEVIAWAGSVRGEKFLKNGKVDLDYCLSGRQTTGIPPTYGINDVNEILD